jgi:hypothetical protein
MTGRRRATLLALLALLGALALLAAGCGGSDNESAADETTIETTTETDESMEETTTSEETTSDDDGDLSAFASEDCLELASIGSKFSESFSGTGDLSDVETFFEALADKAPDEIKDDLVVLAEAMGEYAEAFKDIDLTGAAAADPETIQKLQELASKFDDAKYTQASENIQTWAQENCTTGG